MRNSESSSANRDAANLRMDEDDTTTTAKCRLPPMWRAHPTVWFYQAEAILNVSRVHTDRSKYNLLVAALDPAMLADVADVITNPPEEGNLVDPRDRQLQKMLSELQLDGRKPSQLYRHMKSVSGNLVTDSVIRARWLALLPNDVQNILKIFKIDALEELLVAADQLLETPITANVSVTYGAQKHCTQRPGPGGN